MVAVMDGPITTSEASRIAGVSEGTIRSWLRSGRLPHQRTPLGALISPLALAEVIAVRERRQRETPRSRQIGGR
jgi:excisionase family DNA binding protein